MQGKMVTPQKSADRGRTLEADEMTATADWVDYPHPTSLTADIESVLTLTLIPLLISTADSARG